MVPVPANVPVQVDIAAPWPYQVPTVVGGALVGTSLIPKHVPLLDILAAAQRVAVGVVMTLTLGAAVDEATVTYCSEPSTDGMPVPTHGDTAPVAAFAQM